MRTTVIALIIGLSASAAHSEQPLDAVDYKAAYCAGRLRDIQVPQPSTTSAAANDMLRQLAGKIDHARERLKTYLLPRLNFVDATALLATSQIGVEEQKQYETAMTRCMAKANPSGAISEAEKISACAKDADWPKLKECEEAAFLPF